MQFQQQIICGEITALMKTHGAKLVAAEDLGSNITEETLLYKCKRVNITEKKITQVKFCLPNSRDCHLKEYLMP